MSYTIRKFNGTELVVLQDGTIDTSTSVALVGRNYTGYGELQNQNFLYLLENFSNDSPPPVPIRGQTWFSTENNNLYVYDGAKWTPVGSTTVAENAPLDPSIGSLWFDSINDRLNCWAGQWIPIGPENVAGFGKTKAESTILQASTGVRYPVIILYIDNTVQAIISYAEFTIAESFRPAGFVDLLIGMNFPNNGSSPNIKGNLQGTASKATILENTRLINGVGFDGSANINVKAPTTFYLKGGDYITGSDFDGSEEITWNINAASNNVIGSIVARDSAGNFTAGTITANLIGNVSGNVSTSTGTSTFNIITANQFVGQSLSGNATTASSLRTPRLINGVSFDGTRDITIPVNGENVSGTRLASNVVNSSLNTLGTLSELRIEDAGLSIGNVLDISVDSGVPTIETNNINGLNFSVQDVSVSGGYSSLQFLSASKNLLQGGESVSSIVPDNLINLGETYSNFNKIYSNTFIGNLQGNSDTATLSTTASNLAGGAPNSIAYQTLAGTTGFIPIGSSGQVLTIIGGVPVWDDNVFTPLKRGDYLIGSDYDGVVDTTWSVDATSANTGDKIVARDSSGNFSANIITATLNGNVTGNAQTVSTLEYSQIIAGLGFIPASNDILTNGDSASLGTVSVDGDITVSKSNPTIFFNDSSDAGVELAMSVQGENMIFYEPDDSNKEWFRINDTEEKAYIFGQAINTADTFRITYGNTEYTSSYTNQVGSWNNSYNFFDVYPPTGYTMSNLIGFIPSIAVIHYAGTVNGDDSIRCTWTAFSSYIRVWVQNTEQRSTPAANWLAIWRR